MKYQKPIFEKYYNNFIGGKWIAPIDGEYFDDISPVDGSVIAKAPKSNYKDINLAVKTAWSAYNSWKITSAEDRSNILLKIANRIDENLEKLALVEAWENGKSIRETMAADLPLTADHFRYFGSILRAETGSATYLNQNTLSMEIHEPLGVVGQIIPWNFPILMAAWKLAPALAAGNCVVLKPAEQTPISVLFLVDIISDLLPAGVVNVVNGFGLEAGKALATHKDIMKIAFTGETTTGRLIMQYASETMIPTTLDLGGKSPNIYMDSVMEKDDEYLDKAIEGLVSFALNQGEVCTCPSRALIQENIYDAFMARCMERIKSIAMGDPLDSNTMMGAQISKEQYDKILNYIEIGKKEGATLLSGGEAYKNAVYPNGYYIKPTVFKGHNKMQIFQEEIFGPVLSVTTFKNDEDALAQANDTLYGLAAGVWTRDVHQMEYFARNIDAGRIWCNCYHLYPSHASFGGFKKSGIGRETYKTTLNHYRKVKNIITSYDKNKMGFF
jgi:aldehyde dehydrogenase